MTSRDTNVKSLLRGLDIMRFINSKGAAKPAQIAEGLGIPRPTVYRLLKTLEEAGYVIFSASDTRARVSPLASGLGDNSAARSRLCHVAGAKLIAFTDTQAWPLDLSVFHDLRMMVEETTHWRSPVSVDMNMAGSTLPMIRSSAGRAYLTFCHPKEREIILKLLNEENHPDDRPFLTAQWLDMHLPQFRKQGYATRGPDTFRAKTSSIAVPIWHDGRVIGCLSMIWIASALSLVEASDRYADLLKSISNDISQELEIDPL